MLLHPNTTFKFSYISKKMDELCGYLERDIVEKLTDPVEANVHDALMRFKQAKAVFGNLKEMHEKQKELLPNQYEEIQKIKATILKDIVTLNNFILQKTPKVFVYAQGDEDAEMRALSFSHISRGCIEDLSRALRDMYELLEQDKRSSEQVVSRRVKPATPMQR